MAIKKIIAIASAKGGVGKSTIAACLAKVLGKDNTVGLFDADIYGPSQHLIFNLKDQINSKAFKTSTTNLQPLKKENLLIMSMGFYINKDKSLTWRGPMLSSVLKQIYNQTKWGDLDYLIIDMPPGTGDAYLTIANEVNPDGIILVTTNNIMSAEDTLKSKITFNKLEIPILGFLINMYENSKGKYKMSAKELQNLLDVNCFGTIYFDNNLAEFKSQTITKVFKPIIELI